MRKLNAAFLEYSRKYIYSNLTSSSFRTICIYGLNVYTVLQFAFPQIVKLTKSCRSCVSYYRYCGRFYFLAGPCGDFNWRRIVAWNSSGIWLIVSGFLEPSPSLCAVFMKIPSAFSKCCRRIAKLLSNMRKDQLN